MKIRRLVCALLFTLAAAAPSRADEKQPLPPEPPSAAAKPAPEPKAPRAPQIERIVTVRNVDMMRQLAHLARAFNVNASEFSELGILVLRGTPEAVAAAGQAVEKYDTARPAGKRAEPKSVDVTAYLLVAGNEPYPNAQTVPEPLAAAIAQLKERFPYKHYDLAETIAVRTAADSMARVDGVLPAFSAATRHQKAFYEFTLEGVGKPTEKDGDTSAGVRIGKLRFEIDVPIPDGAGDGKVFRRSLSIQSGVELREGQRVVVGKTTLDGTNSSLILVLTLKVV